MSLIALKQHMMAVKMTTLSHLCSHFNAEPETLRCLLSHWIAKGKIRPCRLKAACGTKCFNCPAAQTEMYEWCEG